MGIGLRVGAAVGEGVSVGTGVGTAVGEGVSAGSSVGTGRGVGLDDTTGVGVFGGKVAPCSPQAVPITINTTRRPQTESLIAHGSGYSA